MNTFLVTGAAGSIGSMVCRALVAAGHRVVGFDIAETPLFWLERELDERGDFIAVIGSVTTHALRRAAKHWSPQAIIHCAALKHVDLCERNVCEAVLTNVLGTRHAVEAAQAVNARLVLLSTDKAVEPTTVMGATKRLAERLCGGVEDARIVRLVNVWGSAGSLIPVATAAIQAGRPVTVTDKRMARYFMSATAAAQIVVGEATDISGQLSVLAIPQVGEPRLIIDVLKELMVSIGRHVDIVETKPKAGEKLVEKLLSAAEAAEFASGQLTIDAPSRGWFIALQRLLRTAGYGEAGPARYSLFKLAECP